VLLDAFSPRRCPQLWTLDFLSGLASLLNPQGRLLTYCSAAAVRRSLELTGLQLASTAPDGNGRDQWAVGTVASPSSLPFAGTLRPLSSMEREHIESRAGEPYRDPGGSASAAQIHGDRAAAQRHSGAPSASAWRRRWLAV
jgi:tRNA U34 5-methylaminomethyl-2-thiouridine-forming methyltransferase MnmC